MKDERIHGIRIKCYAQADNGQNKDRFTIAFPTETYDGHSRLVPCVGFSGHSGAMLGRHLGKRIPFTELPDSLKRTVKADCADYAEANKRTAGAHV